MTKPKVMLIEDDHTMLTLLRTFLQFEGYEVAAIEYDTDLDTLVSAIRREKPVAILMDVNLRQISGLDLLSAVRADPDLFPTRVIMSSGAETSEECYRRGADAFLLKPFMPDELIRKLNNVLASFN